MIFTYFWWQELQRKKCIQQTLTIISNPTHPSWLVPYAPIASSSGLHRRNIAFSLCLHRSILSAKHQAWLQWNIFRAIGTVRIPLQWRIMGVSASWGHSKSLGASKKASGSWVRCARLLERCGRREYVDLVLRKTRARFHLNTPNKYREENQLPPSSSHCMLVRREQL